MDAVFKAIASLVAAIDRLGPISAIVVITLAAMAVVAYALYCIRGTCSDFSRQRRDH